MSKEKLESIESFLAEQGVARETYVLLDTEKDNYVLPFGAKEDAVEKLDFDLEKERIEKHNLPFVHDYNNGTSSILLANGVCVVSQSSEVADLIQKLVDGASKGLDGNAKSAMSRMGVPLSNMETLVASDGSANEQTTEVATMKEACAREREQKEAEKDAQIRESVSEKLEAMGLKQGKYTILTAKDEGVGVKGQDGSVQPFSMIDVQPLGNDEVIADTNGSVSAFYFAEGAYVLSVTEEAMEAVGKVREKNKSSLSVIAMRDTDVFYKDGAPLGSLNDSWNHALMQDDSHRETREMLTNIAHCEFVSEKLEAMGLEEGTYMMLTPQNAKGVVAENEFGDKCPMDLVLQEGAYDIATRGKDVLASYNAGVSAFYFKEGIYVISTSEKAREQAQKIESEQGFIGVAIGKNDTFVTHNGESIESLNTKWEVAKETVRHNETKERQEKAGLEFSEVLYKRGAYGRDRR